MIKLLHLADLHIGMENYGKVDPASGLHSRLVDYLDRLDEAIDFGLEERVDAVLIAGDIYKNRTPNPTHQREFARRVGRLRKAGMPVLILTGNHDVSPAAGRAHAVEIFDTLAVEGVMIIDRPRVEPIVTRSGTFQLIALPWVTRHNLLTREDLRMSSFAEVEAMLMDRIDRFLRTAAAQLDPQLPTVLMFHGTIAGATLGAERQILLGKDLVLPRSFVDLPGVDYVALGHIHKHQSLGEHPPIVYPGSIERIDFGEELETKGCVLVELAKDATTWRFHPLAARPFLTIAVDVRAAPDPQARAAQAIERQARAGALSGAVVRVKIEALPEQVAAIRTEELRAHLEAAGVAVVAAVGVETERAARGRLGTAGAELLEGLTPRRAIELYLRQKTPALAEARIAALLAAADELMAEGA